MLAISQCETCIKADVCGRKGKYDELLCDIGKVTLTDYISREQFSTLEIKDTSEFDVILQCAHYLNQTGITPIKKEKLEDTNFKIIIQTPETLAPHVLCKYPDGECPDILWPNGKTDCEYCALYWLKSKADPDK